MKLYYFTSEKYGIDNLKEKRIKVSIIAELNDPFEFQAGFLKPNKLLRKQFTEFKKKISKEFGLICLSKTWHEPVLWSHYADKHRGMVLGFDLKEDKAINVVYRKNRPLFTSEKIDSNSSYVDYLEKLMKTKSVSWSYEEEVRFYFSLNELIFENGLYFNSFDENMILKEVILGCNSKLSDKEFLGLLKDFKNITAIKSRMAFKSFRIVRNRQKVWSI